MFFRSTSFKVILIIVFALVLGYYDLPSSYQNLPLTPSALQNEKVHLGLDLQGGSQLDYKIDLRRVPDTDRKTIVEGVKNVINRRVNSLGVSEPNIYTSSIGDEQHLVVELAGIKDLDQAKKVVGKTIQLEFKEKREKEDPKHKENMKKLAQSVLKRIQAGTQENSFELIAQEEQQAAPDKVFLESNTWAFRDEIADKNLADIVFKTPAGTVVSQVVEGNEGYSYKDNELVPNSGFFVVKVLDKRDTGELPVDEKAVKVSHLLIAYRDAERASDDVVRTKEEARELADDLHAQLKAGANFETLTKENSDEPNAENSAGKLSAAVKMDGSYDAKFTAAALALAKKGEISDVAESLFGFHIIRADDFAQTKYSKIFFSAAPDPWQETGLTGEHFERADVTFDSLMNPTVSIKFNDEGAKLFEEITERNVNKPLAIFVGGNLISAPNVNQKISGGNAVITGRFSVEEAQALARDLNTGAIPAPVVLSGQYTIGATLGEQALRTSLKAGIVGLILLALFMILYYRLPGLLATIALGVYIAILLFLIKASLSLPAGLAVSAIIFAAIVYTLLKSKEGGWEKLITFVLACFVLFFITFLLSNAVVLTLAGVAGVILSIGMAVDANILIFERTKEELRAGRPLSSAIDVGFDRAWSSIRDSNFSSLITCGILFYFGTSIIQGFAFNLAAGILVSMFTAITITKTFLTLFMKSRFGSRFWLWGVKQEENEPATEHKGIVVKKLYRIVEKSKLWFGISGTIIAIAIIVFAIFGLKLGMDFKGGTLLDISFENPVTAEEIKDELKNTQEGLNAGLANASGAETGNTGSNNAETALESSSQPIVLDNARIVSAGENQYLVSMLYIDNETHDKLLENFEARFGKLTENRFTTIGPVVGETLKKRAVIAVLIAMAMIVLYIAFAFRKVPKHVSPWKFGVCAIIALIHDVIIPIGIFAIFRFEIDALFITAILTVLGFSVHDTIVVFDRIRENLKYQERDESFDNVVNKSVSQTMARSINTSATVFITLMALLLLGSSSIFHFVLVLVIGIVVGTYSSIFIASPLLALWQKNR